MTKQLWTSEAAAKATRRIYDSKKDGGATINTSGERADIKTGYMVSIPGNEVRVPESAGVNALMPEVKNKLKKVQDMPAGYYVGAWFDGGDIVLDVSVNVQDEAEALRLGKLWNQDSIYNAEYLTNGKDKYISCK
jgi:hypothetical protein